MGIESSQLIVFIILTGLEIYVLVCNEVSVVSKKRGLKWAPVFLISFFATSVVGLLYAIIQLMNEQTINKAEL